MWGLPVGGRLSAGNAAVEFPKARDALVSRMRLNVSQAVDQLEDGRGPQLALTQDEPIPGS